ncbi:NACHT domain-containing protein [Rickettsiales endosymbiont of Peranema trichophorum]|uniref:NACHT domain-containing protein n=1 Tax=Rickettsiales endosymbiont of Peranema trichophorum TaxID=2486577 RepID=UPI001023DF98|nr:NACHT domain-containing protein [Rickettsiales endosymbiont of Peranema trichophorum]RZI47005.1 NACHT domain-containing protein [Rickettsiales endosymbiont of Peranema trichophorum]
MQPKPNPENDPTIAKPKHPLSEKLKAFYKAYDVLPKLIEDERLPEQKIKDYYVKLEIMLNAGADRKPIEVPKIFDEVGDQKATGRVLITAAAGMGKSTLLHYITHQWGQDQMFAEKFEYMFKVKLKTLTSSGYTEKSDNPLVSLILNDLETQWLDLDDQGIAVSSIDEREIKEVLIDKEYDDKVLLLLDGYDEVAHLEGSNAAFRKVLRDVWTHGNVLLTSRPNAVSDKISGSFERRIEGNGLEQSGVIEYINKYFEYQKHSGDPEQEGAKSKLLELYQSNPSLRETLKIPINTVIVCLSSSGRGMEERFGGEFSLGGLYQNMMIWLSRRYLAKFRGEQVLDMSDHPGILRGVEDVFGVLERMSYESFRNDLLVISGRDIERLVEQEKRSYKLMRDMYQYGLLRTDNVGMVQYSVEQLYSKQYEFVHLSFQEWLVADYLKCKLLQEGQGMTEAIQFISEHRNEPRYLMVLKFLSGLVSNEQGEKSNLLVTRFWDSIVCNVEGVLEFDIVGKVKLLMHTLGQAKVQGKLDTRIPSLEKMVNLIDAEVCSNVSEWVDDIGSSGYVSEGTKNRLLKPVMDWHNTSDGELKLSLNAIQYLSSKLVSEAILEQCGVLLDSNRDWQVKKVALKASASIMNAFGKDVDAIDMIDKVFAHFMDHDLKEIVLETLISISKVNGVFANRVLELFIPLLNDRDVNPYCVLKVIVEVSSGVEAVSVKERAIHLLVTLLCCDSVRGLSWKYISEAIDNISSGSYVSIKEKALIKVLIPLLKDSSKDAYRVVEAIYVVVLGIDIPVNTVNTMMGDITQLRDQRFVHYNWWSSVLGRCEVASVSRLSSEVRQAIVESLLPFVKDDNVNVATIALTVICEIVHGSKLSSEVRQAIIELLVSFLKDSDRARYMLEALDWVVSPGRLSSEMSQAVVELLIPLLKDNGGNIARYILGEVDSWCKLSSEVRLVLVELLVITFGDNCELLEIRSILQVLVGVVPGCPLSSEVRQGVVELFIAILQYFSNSEESYSRHFCESMSLQTIVELGNDVGLMLKVLNTLLLTLEGRSNVDRICTVPYLVIVIAFKAMMKTDNMNDWDAGMVYIRSCFSNHFQSLERREEYIYNMDDCGWGMALAHALLYISSCFSNHFKYLLITSSDIPAAVSKLGVVFLYVLKNADSVNLRSFILDMMSDTYSTCSMLGLHTSAYRVQIIKLYISLLSSTDRDTCKHALSVISDIMLGKHCFQKGIIEASDIKCREVDALSIEVVKGLLALLNDENVVQDICDSTLQTIERIGSKVELSEEVRIEAIKSLIPLLEHEDRSICISALRAMEVMILGVEIPVGMMKDVVKSLSPLLSCKYGMISEDAARVRWRIALVAKLTQAMSERNITRFMPFLYEGDCRFAIAAIVKIITSVSVPVGAIQDAITELVYLLQYECECRATASAIVKILSAYGLPIGLGSRAVELLIPLLEGKRDTVKWYAEYTVMEIIESVQIQELPELRTKLATRSKVFEDTIIKTLIQRLSNLTPDAALLTTVLAIIGHTIDERDAEGSNLIGIAKKVLYSLTATPEQSDEVIAIVWQEGLDKILALSSASRQFLRKLVQNVFEKQTMELHEAKFIEACIENKVAMIFNRDGSVMLDGVLYHFGDDESKSHLQDMVQQMLKQGSVLGQQYVSHTPMFENHNVGLKLSPVDVQQVHSIINADKVLECDRWDVYVVDVSPPFLVLERRNVFGEYIIAKLFVENGQLRKEISKHHPHDLGLIKAALFSTFGKVAGVRLYYTELTLESGFALLNRAGEVMQETTYAVLQELITTSQSAATTSPSIAAIVPTVPSYVLVDINKLKRVSVFLSYNWGKSDLVDEIEVSLNKLPQVDVKRDKRDLQYRSNIEEFMRQARNTDFVVVVITDKYLKSRNCMNEILELTSDDNFRQRMLPVVEPAAEVDIAGVMSQVNIYSQTGAAHYIQYWEGKLDELKHAIGGSCAAREAYTQELQKTEEFMKRVGPFLLNDIRFINALSVEDLRRSNFEEMRRPIQEKQYKWSIEEQELQSTSKLCLSTKSGEPKLLKLNGMGNDMSLSSHGGNEKYWYSIGDGLRLLWSIRMGKLSYEVEARPGEEYNAYRENRECVFVSDPYYIDNLEDYLIDDMKIITGRHGVSRRNQEWVNKPKVLIVPLLHGLHWKCLKMSIDYDRKSIGVLYDDPYGKEIDDVLDDRLIKAVREAGKMLFGVKVRTVTIDSKEMDQQGLEQGNGYDCGPIVFSNIRDYVSDRDYTIRSAKEREHRKQMLEIRERDIREYGEVSGISIDEQLQVIRDKIKVSLEERARGESVIGELLSEDLAPEVVDMLFSMLEEKHKAEGKVGEGYTEGEVLEMYGLLFGTNTQAYIIKASYESKAQALISSYAGMDLLYTAYEIGGQILHDAFLNVMYEEEQALGLLCRAKEIGSRELVMELMKASNTQGATGASFIKEGALVVRSTTGLGGGIDVQQSTNMAGISHQKITMSSTISSFIEKLSNKLDIIWKYKQYLHKAEITRFHEILKRNSLDETTSLDTLRDDTEFKKSVLLKLHPDKGGKAEDFVFARELQQKMNSDVDINAIIAEKAQKIQMTLYKTSLGVKVADTVVDVLRAVNQPTLENGKKVVFDTVHLYGMCKGLNGYGLAVGALEASYQVYQGEYTEAVKHLLITGAYMALPMVMAATGVPYAGLLFAVVMTAYSGYHLVSNTHALYVEYTSEDNAAKSSEAYAYLYDALVKTPLHCVYESEAPSISVENDVPMTDEQASSLQEAVYDV